jgi:hypothetical protein
MIPPFISYFGSLMAGVIKMFRACDFLHLLSDTKILSELNVRRCHGRVRSDVCQTLRVLSAKCGHSLKVNIH